MPRPLCRTFGAPLTGARRGAAAVSKMAGIMQRSTQIMQSMNHLLRVPEIQQTMQSLAREMTKAGLIDEIVNDAIDSTDTDETEAEADSEVNAVLQEVTNGILGQAPKVSDGLPGEAVAADGTRAEEQEEEEAMRERMQALQS